MAKKRASGWTVETAIQYLSEIRASDNLRLDQRFDAEQRALRLGMETQRQLMDGAFAAAKEAVDKANLASEKRFDNVNEFRAALLDQQRTLMPRSEVESMIQVNAERIEELKDRLNALQNERLGIRGGWGYAVGVVGFVLLVFSLLTLYHPGH